MPNSYFSAECLPKKEINGMKMVYVNEFGDSLCATCATRQIVHMVRRKMRGYPIYGGHVETCFSCEKML